MSWRVAMRERSVVDGGDVIGIMQRGGEPVRIPAYTLVAAGLYLGAQPVDEIPEDVDVIVNVDSVRFYEVPDDVLYLHLANLRDEHALPDVQLLHRMAGFVNDLRSSGKVVYVHCRLGLNRSGLLVALALMHDGYSAGETLRILRSKRSEWVLYNKTFEAYLHQKASATRRSAQDSSSASNRATPPAQGLPKARLTSRTQRGRLPASRRSA